MGGLGSGLTDFSYMKRDWGYQLEVWGLRAEEGWERGLREWGSKVQKERERGLGVLVVGLGR